jgi:hypothetical protein
LASIFKKLANDGKGKLTTRHEVATVATADASEVALCGDCNLQMSWFRADEHGKERPHRMVSPGGDRSISPGPFPLTGTLSLPKATLLNTILQWFLSIRRCPCMRNEHGTGDAEFWPVAKKYLQKRHLVGATRS